MSVQKGQQCRPFVDRYENDLEKARKDAIRAARELCYSKACILKLKEAKTQTEMVNILKQERINKK